MYLFNLPKDTNLYNIVYIDHLPQAIHNKIQETETKAHAHTRVIALGILQARNHCHRSPINHL